MSFDHGVALADGEGMGVSVRRAPESACGSTPKSFNGQ